MFETVVYVLLETMVDAKRFIQNGIVTILSLKVKDTNEHSCIRFR